MRSMSAPHTHSQLVDRAGAAGPTQVDMSLDEPAVTAIVPMMAWCMAIFCADG